MEGAVHCVMKLCDCLLNVGVLCVLNCVYVKGEKAGSRVRG